MLVEFAWRGWSHGSMFLAGGSCFLLLGRLNTVGLKLPGRLALGVLAITAVELGAGLLFNRGYQVWDYRGMPLNFHGQICLPFCLLWLPLAWAGMGLYRKAERKVGEVLRCEI